MAHGPILSKLVASALLVALLFVGIVQVTILALSVRWDMDSQEGFVHHVGQTNTQIHHLFVKIVQQDVQHVQAVLAVSPV